MASARLLYSREEFIKLVRDRVLEVYKCIPEARINRWGETDAFILLISGGVKLLCRKDFYDGKGNGTYDFWVQNVIDKEEALHLIQTELLPRLVAAGEVAMPAGTPDTARGTLADLVRVIESWFGVGGSVEEPKGTSDVRGALTLLTSELVDLGKMLKGYAELQSAVRWSERQTPSEVEEFTAQQKANLAACLTEAEAGFRDEVVTAADIKIKLVRVLGILQQAPAYVEPARAAGTPVVPVVDTGEVVKREQVEGYWGQSDMHIIEVRKFDASDPRGVYQRWVDGNFDRTLPEYKEAGMPAMTQMRGLLGRLEALG